MTKKLDVVDEAHARRILQELAERTQRKSRFSLKDVLFAQQLGFVESKAKRKVAVCSRRAGKSFGIAALLLQSGLNFPGSTPIYITMSRPLSRDIMWPAFQALDEQFQIGLRFKKNTGDVELPNGSRILLRGAGSYREIDKMRGPKYPLAVVDEAQGFGLALRYMLEQVLEPATMDYNGSLVVSGTPNAACAGPFFEISADHEHNGWEQHRWTCRDNPHIPNIDEWLENLKRSRGWTNETPAYLREYCGLWVRETEGLVYRLDEARNVVESWPREAASDWVFVLAIDIGFNDPTAFCVLAYSATLRQVFVLESYKTAKLAPSTAAAHVERLKEKYPIVKIVADTGGIGKGYVEEWAEKHQIYADAAEKSKKLTYIEMLNSDLGAGQVKIVRSTNPDLIMEVKLLPWDVAGDSGKYKEDPRFPNHLADALLYGWRECRHHIGRDQYNLPAKGEKGWADWHEQELIRKLKEKRSKPWWQRIGQK